MNGIIKRYSEKARGCVGKQEKVTLLTQLGAKLKLNDFGLKQCFGSGSSVPFPRIMDPDMGGRNESDPNGS